MRAFGDRREQVPFLEKRAHKIKRAMLLDMLACSCSKHPEKDLLPLLLLYQSPTFNQSSQGPSCHDQSLPGSGDSRPAPLNVLIVAGQSNSVGLGERTTQG